MDVVISPYHLTTREPPALAALLLAEHVVTVVPAPFTQASGREALAAARRAPRYQALMESWRWTTPLWHAGVIAGELAGHDPVVDVRAVVDRITSDPALAELRGLVRSSLFDDEREYLDAVADDLLRAGPDPGISVPLHAGLDRFAARERIPIARPQPVSVVQRAEAARGIERFAVALPVLLQAGGESLLLARDLLEPELVQLRAALLDALEEPARADAPRASAPSLPADLARAAREYSAAFESNRAELAASVDPQEPRLITGAVVVSVLDLAADAVLRSTIDTMRTLGAPAPEEQATARVSTQLATRDQSQHLRLRSFIIRRLGSVRPTR